MREGSCSSNFLRCVSSVTAAPKAGLKEDELRRMVEEARIPQKPRMVGTPRTSRDLGDGTGRWRCRDCGIEKGVEGFYIKDGRFVRSYCKTCQNLRDSVYKRTLRGNASVLLSSARRRSNLKGWSFNLDTDFIFDLILQQQGRCAYSGLKMELLVPHSDWRMSLERLDNQFGYLRENCVLIAAEFNTAGRVSKRVAQNEQSGSSKWSLEKVQRLPADRDSNLNLKSLQQLIEAAHMRPQRLVQADALTADGSAHQESLGNLRCSRCRLLKPVHCFALQHGDLSGFERCCGQCRAACRSLAYRMSLRGHIHAMLHNARNRHRLGKRAGDFELDLDSVLDILWSQQGRCFYSDVPLRFGQLNVDWMMSLERLDNSRTYTTDNTVIVALEFNTPDNSMRSVGPIFGSSQWSRSKVEHVWGSPRSQVCC